MSTSPDIGFAQPYLCRDCGSEVGFRSRRRNFIERYILPLLLLQPVRCGDCFRRDYRLIFTNVRERLSDARRIPHAGHTATPNRHVAEEHGPRLYCKGVAAAVEPCPRSTEGGRLQQ